MDNCYLAGKPGQVNCFLNCRVATTDHSYFGVSVEGAIAHADDLSRFKYGRNLAEYADQALLSKQLATLYTNLELPVGLEDLRVTEPNRTACRELFMELEFRRLVDDYVEEPTATAKGGGRPRLGEAAI